MGQIKIENQKIASDSQRGSLKFDDIEFTSIPLSSTTDRIAATRTTGIDWFNEYGIGPGNINKNNLTGSPWGELDDHKLFFIPSVNAIDIDWNGIVFDVNSLSSSNNLDFTKSLKINTTSDLIKILLEMYNMIKSNKVEFKYIDSSKTIQINN